MLAATRRWFKRNRANLVIGAGVIGAGYVAGQYVISKLLEARQRMSDDRIAKENLRRRFQQNQEDCSFTVLAILPTATENLIEALPVEDTLAELQKQKAERVSRSGAASEAASSVGGLLSGPGSTTDEDTRASASMGSDSFVHASQIEQSVESLAERLEAPGQVLRSKKSKMQLWGDLKINSIARSFTLLYTLALLTLLTRIQLNLLGRRNYLASVVSLATPQRAESRITLEDNDDDNFERAYGNDFETNRKYLSFSWWLLHKGCKDLLEVVIAAVTEVFGPVNLREDITLQKLSELTIEVRKKVEGTTEEERQNKKWLPFLIPPPDREAYLLHESGMISSPPSPDPSESADANPLISSALRRLLDETSDLIDSPAFSTVLTQLLDAGFTHLTHNKIAPQAFRIPPVSASSQRIVELVDPANARSKLASTLPVYLRQAHAIGAGDVTSGTAGGGAADPTLASIAGMMGGPPDAGAQGPGSNEYLAAMEAVRELEAFAAVVYSSNFDYEVADGGPSAGATPGAGATVRGGDATDRLEVGGGLDSRPSTSGTGIWGMVREERGGEDSGAGVESGFEAAWGKATVGKVQEVAREGLGGIVEEAEETEMVIQEPVAEQRAQEEAVEKAVLPSEVKAELSVPEAVPAAVPEEVDPAIEVTGADVGEAEGTLLDAAPEPMADDEAEVVVERPATVADEPVPEQVEAAEEVVEQVPEPAVAEPEVPESVVVEPEAPEPVVDVPEPVVDVPEPVVPEPAAEPTTAPVSDPVRTRTPEPTVEPAVEPSAASSSQEVPQPPPQEVQAEEPPPQVPAKSKKGKGRGKKR